MNIYYDSINDNLIIISGPHLYPLTDCFFGRVSLIDSFYEVRDEFKVRKLDADSYFNLIKNLIYIGEL